MSTFLKETVSLIKDLPELIPYLKDWWAVYSYQNSQARVEDAVTRLAIYKKYLDKEPAYNRNPYEYPDDYDSL